MNEDQMRRIREQRDRLDELERERRQQLRREVHSSAGRDDVLSIAFKTVLFGMVPSVLWIAWTAATVTPPEPMVTLFLLCVGNGALLLFVLPAATASGLAAHWWFHDSVISGRRAAIMLALLADAVLFGWVLVLTRP